MRGFDKVRIAIAAVSLAAVMPGARAAAITWNTPTTDTGNASDIVTSGSLFTAAYMGDIGYGVNQVTGDDIVNGVDFGYQIGSTGAFNTYSNITISGLTGTIGAAFGSGAPGTWDSGYAQLTGYANGSFWGANPGLSLNLSDLVVGDSYEVQLFTPWWNQPYTGTTFSDGTNTSAAVGIGVANNGTVTATPQYVTGTFTATSSTESIYPFTTGGGGEEYLVAAIEVRDTTQTSSPTPEPGALGLVTAGLIAFGFLRRRIAGSADKRG